MSTVDFDGLQQKILEKEAKDKKALNWAFYKEMWSLKRNALKELKSLYEKLGGEQFMKLASVAILTDQSYCVPDGLYNLLPNTEKLSKLAQEFEDEIASVNKKYLSKFCLTVEPQEHIHIIEFLVESIGNENVSKEFVDAVRLNPDSTLFSKENIEAYGQSIKDGDWTNKDNKTVSELRDEAIQMADEYANNKKYYDATKMYDNAIELVENDDTLLCDLIFKMILCHMIESGYRVTYDLEKYSVEYPVFKVSKEYTYLDSIKDVTELTFDRELKKNKLIRFTDATNNYFNGLIHGHVTDPLITNLLLCIKNQNL